MACTCSSNQISAGIAVLCDNNAGGIKRILVAELCNVQSTAVTTEGTVDSITMETGKQFWEINTQRLTASLEENETNNLDNGSKYYDQVLNIVLAKRDTAKRNAIKLMGAGQKDLAFLVQDSNNYWWCVGFNEGLKLFTNTSGTGTKKEDLNGYTIQFTGQDSVLMSYGDLTDSEITALLSPA